MDVFIKPVKKALITGRKAVRLNDIAEVYCQGNTNLNIGDTIVFNIPENSSKNEYLISVVDIVRAIGQRLPDATINNVGEMDTIIEYSPEAANERPVYDAFKIAFVCVVLFGGAMTAIMSFHSDAQMPVIFQNIYRLFFGIESTKPYIIYIPYSIGLAVGIIVFFNHFGGKYITKDPTPIEVQMTTYEKETTDSVIDNLSREKQNDNS
ncbi:MAG: stage V sporulation protein AA [Clostridiales bacterium]|nr:stage V sporulation protein AA [Clostridiales bacterium]